MVSSLSPSGAQLIQNLSQVHGVSTDAVTHMLQAVYWPITRQLHSVDRFSHR